LSFKAIVISKLWGWGEDSDKNYGFVDSFWIRDGVVICGLGWRLRCIVSSYHCLVSTRLLASLQSAFGYHL